MKALNFYNFSSEDFTYTFDSVPYTFKAKQSMYMEDYKAYHFSKHLVDRELNKLGIPTNMTAKREELGKLCFPEDVELAPAVALDLEEKKKVKTTKKVEKEFEDLEETPDETEEEVKGVKKTKKN